MRTERFKMYLSWINPRAEKYGGNAEIYRQALNEYLSENHYIADKLSSAIHEKDMLMRHQIVHKIKSSSGVSEQNPYMTQP